MAHLRQGKSEYTSDSPESDIESAAHYLIRNRDRLRRCVYNHSIIRIMPKTNSASRRALRQKHDLEFLSAYASTSRVYILVHQTKFKEMDI